MQVTFDHSEPANPAGTARTFWFKSTKPVRQIAGQYTELRLPHPDADDRGVKRWFTISSSPTSEMMSITTKLAGDQGSTFKRALVALEPGTEVQMAEPMGDFVLPKDKSIPLLFVAGGIGITPMHSMIQWLKDTGEERQITLLYAVNKLDELAFEDLFKSTPGVILKPIVSEPPEGWTGLTGRLTADAILAEAPAGTQPMIFISGPEPMVETLEKDLHAKGVNKKQLVLDFFPGYPDS